MRNLTQVLWDWRKLIVFSGKVHWGQVGLKKGKLANWWAFVKCLLDIQAPGMVQVCRLVTPIMRHLFGPYLQLNKKENKEYKKFSLCSDLKTWQLQTWVQLHSYFPVCCRRASCAVLEPPWPPPPHKPGSKIGALNLSCPSEPLTSPLHGVGLRADGALTNTIYTKSSLTVPSAL